MPKKKVVEIPESAAEFVHVKTIQGVFEVKEDGSRVLYHANSFFIVPNATAQEWIADGRALLCDEKNEVIPIPEPEPSVDAEVAAVAGVIDGTN